MADRESLRRDSVELQLSTGECTFSVDGLRTSPLTTTLITVIAIPLSSTTFQSRSSHRACCLHHSMSPITYDNASFLSYLNRRNPCLVLW